MIAAQPQARIDKDQALVIRRATPADDTHAARDLRHLPLLTAGAFWDAVYLPCVKKNKRSSTLTSPQDC